MERNCPPQPLTPTPPDNHLQTPNPTPNNQLPNIPAHQLLLLQGGLHGAELLLGTAEQRPLSVQHSTQCRCSTQYRTRRVACWTLATVCLTHTGRVLDTVHQCWTDCVEFVGHTCAPSAPASKWPARSGAAPRRCRAAPAAGPARPCPANPASHTIYFTKQRLCFRPPPQYARWGLRYAGGI